ncbi:MAG: pilus assembly protein PilP [Legionellales bacterium]|nr:pilus assembly protein PilP [Legionellales bacterium]
MSRGKQFTFIRNYQWIVMLSCLVLCGLLSACADHEHKDLKKYVNDTLARPGTKIEPLPKMDDYQAHEYSSSSKRSPFQPPKPKVNDKNASEIRPDVNRPKEELEQFSLDSMAMVGTFSQNNQTWALISAPNGTIYRVRAGNYLGKDYGKIQSIESKKMVIIETISDGQGGWIHRQRELKLESRE